MKDYILDRIKEPSTWRGLVYLATAAGLHISPEAANAVITAGLAIAGLIGALTPGK